MSNAIHSPDRSADTGCAALRDSDGVPPEGRSRREIGAGWPRECHVLDAEALLLLRDATFRGLVQGRQLVSA